MIAPCRLYLGFLYELFKSISLVNRSSYLDSGLERENVVRLHYRWGLHETRLPYGLEGASLPPPLDPNWIARAINGVTILAAFATHTAVFHIGYYLAILTPMMACRNTSSMVVTTMRMVLRPEKSLRFP
ncbi:hypothetical protein VNO77_34275 [Canavalia gladiata]|uniref:Uncharacterized protein n=1 Tax=Canavalia gladiata TaxID=3824 RepID=A0AAN9PZ43_CANGL